MHDLPGQPDRRSVEIAVQLHHVATREGRLGAQLTTPFGDVDDLSVDHPWGASLMRNRHLGRLAHRHPHMATTLHSFILADEENLQRPLLAFEQAAADLREPTLIAEAHPNRRVGFQIDRRCLFACDDQQVPTRARDTALPDDDTAKVLDYDLFAYLDTLKSVK